MNRRTFLQSSAVLAASAAPAWSQAASGKSSDLIASIEKVTLVRGRDGSAPTWFHPRACPVPGAGGGTVFMTLQTIAGSDFFGPVHWMTSRDLGKTWTDPVPAPPLGRVKQGAGPTEEGVCDVVPEWHPKTKSVLAMGHNVFYSGPKFSADQPPRWPIYAVWRDGQWGPRRKLEWNDPRGAQIYSNNCGQRVVLPNGNIQMSFTYGVKGKPRSVSGVICSFDGETLAVKHVGEEIQLAKGRGLLEPSVTQFQGLFYLTIRAEDNHGYVCAGDDGLKWTPKQPWAWENGEPLTLSTTQQHWLTHSEALWLVYTRKDATNLNVPRWRSPLWMAQVDTKKLCLLRDTERVVLPLVGDGVNKADEVAYSGNFHPVNVSPDESWVTDGEMLPKRGWKGDLLLARIRWTKPNKLVAG